MNQRIAWFWPLFQIRPCFSISNFTISVHANEAAHKSDGLNSRPACCSPA